MPEFLTSVTPKKIPLVRSQSAPLPTTRVGSLADEMLLPPVHLGYLDQEDLEHLETVEAQRQMKSPNANLKPVRKSFLRLPEHMRRRYSRTPCTWFSQSIVRGQVGVQLVLSALPTTFCYWMHKAAEVGAWYHPEATGTGTEGLLANYPLQSWNLKPET